MSFVKTKQIVPFTQGATVTVANTTTETTLVSTTGIGGVELIKNGFTVGKTYRVSGCGVFSNTGTPTLELKVKFGATVVLDSGAITTTTSASNREFYFTGLLTVTALGASGAVIGQGLFHETATSGSGKVYPLSNASAVTVDTTTNQTVNVTVTWGAASASNTITLTNFLLEELN
mgnify:CR=1 FL=1